jgi:FAD/FMN-containing dehydrogenase
MSLSIVWRDKADPEVYEEARLRRVFNHQRPERYPLAIVFVKTESEIVNAVRLAIEKKCRISLRSGGHSWPAWSVRDDAVLVDLGDYSEVILDANTGAVRVSPSTTGMDLNSYLFTKGRVVSVGHCPDVGMGGFLLSGGMGWNCNVRSLPLAPYHHG